MFIWGGGSPLCSAGLMTKTTTWFENHPVVKWTTIVLTAAAIVMVGLYIGAAAGAAIAGELAEEAVAEVVVEIVYSDTEAGAELDSVTERWQLRKFAPLL